MHQYFKARTFILSIILSLSIPGQVFADNKVVVVPLGADTEKPQWALIDGYNGTILAQSGGISLIKEDVGFYYVNFSRDVTGHAVIVSGTIGNHDIGARICGGEKFKIQETIYCSAQNSTSHVRVYASDRTGSYFDTTFYLTILP